MFSYVDLIIFAFVIVSGLSGPTLLRSLRTRRATFAPVRLVEVPAPAVEIAVADVEQPVRVAA